MILVFRYIKCIQCFGITVVAKRSRKGSKVSSGLGDVSGHTPLQSSDQNVTGQQTDSVRAQQRRRGGERRNLASAFDSVTMATNAICDSDDSEVSTKLIIDEPGKKRTSKRKASMQKKAQSKVLPHEDTADGHDSFCTNTKHTPQLDETVQLRSHKRKSVSPQKHVSVMSPGTTHIDMPMSLTSPPRNYGNTAGKNGYRSAAHSGNPPGSVAAGPSGSQRRKLLSPSKKYIDMPVFPFNDGSEDLVQSVEESQDFVTQSDGDGITGHVVDQVQLSDVIHIYPQNGFADLGIENPQVPQPIFTINTSPTKYMVGATEEGATLSTLKAAALSSGILSDEEDIETTARELGISVQL